MSDVRKLRERLRALKEETDATRALLRAAVKTCGPDEEAATATKHGRDPDGAARAAGRLLELGFERDRKGFWTKEGALVYRQGIHFWIRSSPDPKAWYAANGPDGPIGGYETNGGTNEDLMAHLDSIHRGRKAPPCDGSVADSPTELTF